jgi:uncharacterized protein (DUF39 family)
MKKHKAHKTFQEINRKIQSGDAVVVTAEEIIDIVKENGAEEAARHADIVQEHYGFRAI